MKDRRNNRDTVNVPSTRFTNLDEQQEKFIKSQPIVQEHPLGTYLLWLNDKWRVKFNNDVIGHIRLINRNTDTVTPGPTQWCYRCWNEAGTWLADLSVEISMLMQNPDPLYRAVEFIIDSHSKSDPSQDPSAD